MLTFQLGSGFSVVILSLRWSDIEQRLLLEVPYKLWLILDVVSSSFIIYLHQNFSMFTDTCISLAFIYKVYVERDGLKTTTM